MCPTAFQVRASDVPLPEAATFVVANSLTVSNKAETGEGRYNLRVVECRLAAIMIALALDRSKVLPSSKLSGATMKVSVLGRVFVLHALQMTSSHNVVLSNESRSWWLEEIAA